MSLYGKRQNVNTLPLNKLHWLQLSLCYSVGRSEDHNAGRDFQDEEFKMMIIWCLTKYIYARSLKHITCLRSFGPNYLVITKNFLKQKQDMTLLLILAKSKFLSIRSQYFRTAFSNEWAEKKDGKFIFRKPNIPPQLFNIILR